MPRIDNFISQQTSTSSRWSLSDAWIVNGGKYICLEFTNTISSSGVWNLATQNLTLESDSGGNLFASLKHVQYESRTGETLVYLIGELSRIVSRTEIITMPSTSQLATSTDGKHCLSTSQITVRNFSNCDSSGNPSYSLRSGSNTNNLKATDLSASSSYSLVSTTVPSGGIWGNLSTVIGDLTYNASDADFNNKPSITLSSEFIGKLNGFTLSPVSDSFTWFVVLRITDGSAFYISYVDEQGGTFVGSDLETIARPIRRFSPDAWFVTTQLNLTNDITYDITNIWTVLNTTTNKGKQEFDIANSSPRTCETGNLKSRTITLGIRFDNSTDTVTFFTGNGNIISKTTISSLENFSGGDFFSIRTGLGTVKISEFRKFSTALTDNQIQEYTAFLDNKYGTNAKQIHIDLSSGNDTTGTGTSSLPYKTISKGLNDVVVGSGDQLLLKCGSSLTNSNEIVIDSPQSGTPLGYSPDYPFVIGYYSTRSSGRPEIDFDISADSYIKINTKKDNVCLNGIYLHSSERVPYTASYGSMLTNLSAGKGRGVGIEYDVSHDSNFIPSSFQIVDSDIANCFRHSVCLRSSSTTFPNQLKYSSARRNIIRESVNPSNVLNQDHEPNLSASSNYNFGIAGIYGESIGGCSILENIFYRIGWYPEFIVGYVTSATYASSDTSFTGLDILSLPSAAWNNASSEDDDIQRIKITLINASPANNKNGKIKSIVSNKLSIKSDGASSTGLLNGNTVNFQVIDGLPRNAGNADIVLMGKRTSGTQAATVEFSCLGPYILANNIHMEPSGYLVLSHPSYYTNRNIAQNIQYGYQASPDYSTFEYNFIGGSVGTDQIRKSPKSRISGQEHSIGNINTSHYGTEHAWHIKTPKNFRSKKIQINNNIVYIPKSYAYGGSPSYDAPSFATYPPYYPSASIFIDSTPTGLGSFINIQKNTFHNIPGSVVIYASNNTSDDINIERNILDQEVTFTAGTNGDRTSQFFYSFIDPFTTNTGDYLIPSYGGTLNFNVYNRSNATSDPNLNSDVHILTQNSSLDPFDLTFQEWKDASSDDGIWKDIQYATSGRDLNLYAYDQLGFNTSAIDFITNAISVLDGGWSNAYSAENVLNYIRQGYVPTNLNKSDYNNDYVGAVEFTSSGTPSFNVFYTKYTILHGFGRGY